MPKTRLFLIFFLLLLTAYFLSGCATVPKNLAGQPEIPVYNIRGSSYVPLVTLCDLYGINWSFDTFTRSVVLTRDLHRVYLKVGENVAIVDGVPQQLPQPVEFYEGTVAIPLKFKEGFFDPLFRRVPAAPSARAFEPWLLRIKKVAIDAGHGGNDPGAIGRTGLREKDVNLDIAKRLSKLLRDAGLEVVLVRSTDQFIPLQRRVDIANSSKADLFVSIHSNANRVRGLNGFEVYYVSPKLNDNSRALAAATSTRLNLNRSWFASDSVSLRATLWDMLYSSGRAESIRLARSICRTIDDEMDTRVIGVKGANFFVLKGASTPAVLIEIGFVSNREEERRLKNNFYRQQIAEAIASGIKEYARDYSITEASR
jgi:N-acetylmuramoyl-L-alanine amidase